MSRLGAGVIIAVIFGLLIFYVNKGCDIKVLKVESNGLATVSQTAKRSGYSAVGSYIDGKRAEALDYPSDKDWMRVDPLDLLNYGNNKQRVVEVDSSFEMAINPPTMVGTSFLFPRMVYDNEPRFYEDLDSSKWPKIPGFTDMGNITRSGTKLALFNGTLYEPGYYFFVDQTVANGKTNYIVVHWR